MSTQISNSTSRGARAYRPGRRRVLLAALIAAAFAGTIFFVREPLADLGRTHAALLFGGGTRFATASDRAEWLKRHPGQLRVAFVGDWEKGGASVAACRTAFERAMAGINGKGGVRGRKLVADWVNVARTGDSLQIALTRLACEASYFAVFMSVRADALLEAKPILLQGRLLTFAPGVTNVRVTRPEDLGYIFMPNPSDADVAEGIAEWLVRQPVKSLHACCDPNADSAGLFEELQKSLQARAVSEYYCVPYGSDLGQARVQKVFCLMNDMLKSVNVVLANDGADPKAERNALAWLLGAAPGNIVVKKSVPGDWSEADRKRIFVTDRISDAEAASLSVWLLADAFAKAKAPTPDAVAAALRNGERETPSGPFRFTQSRFAAVAPVVVRPMVR